MTSAINERLIREAPRSVENLLALLTEGLAWPIPDHLDTIPLLKWSPEELHLDPRQVGHLMSIQQVPRLTQAQPFGVFVLTFEGGRLPVGAVRRLVHRLIRKKRASVQGAQKGLWDLHDLIFFCQSQDGGGTVHVVAFSEAGPRPVMRVISWDASASETRLEMLSRDTLPDLAWPARDVTVGEWRQHWDHAFRTTYRQGVRSAADLAKNMAIVARAVRDTVLDMLPLETADGPLRGIFEDVKKSLIADLDFHAFADMYAQTMVYGLLTARITHPEDFAADSRRTVLQFENPFLNAIYDRMRDEAQDAFDTDELGLQDLADLLARSDMNEVLADFGAASRRDDPVVHFYEDFLKEYDPAQQIELGVYYTAQPVVQYQVRTVDKILKEKFGLPLGVADSTTWAELTARIGVPVPDGVDPDGPFVTMLDPATGTGTYLVEWLRQAEANVRQDATKRGIRGAAQDELWASVCFELVLPQMSAFEISLASYTVAHLKVALQLPVDVRQKVRIPVYLTDTLAPPRGIGQLTMDPDPMSEESELADRVKLSRATTVIIGNPPYRERARGRGGVVEQSSSSLAVPSLDAFREPGHGRLEFNLHNLNVYFWRWATWKAIDQHPGVGGIVSFITTSPYMASGAFAGMRRYLRANASTLRLIDCTPEGHQPEVSTRLFPGVQQPLAIMTVASCLSEDRASDFTYGVVLGSRHEKFDVLAGPTPPAGSPISGSGAAPLATVSDGWSSMPSMTDVMPFATTGLTTNRSWVIGTHPEVLLERWRTLAHTSAGEMNEVMKATRDRDARRSFVPIPGFPARGSLVDDHKKPPATMRFAYRAFDNQYLLADSRVIDFPRPPLWEALSDSQIYVIEHHSEPIRRGPGLLFTGLLPASSLFKGSGGGRVLPVWRDSGGSVANLSPRFLSTWSTALGADQDASSWLAYLAAVTGTAAYQLQFESDLTTPGIRFPVSADAALVEQAQRLGAAILWCHTLGIRGVAPDSVAGLPVLTIPVITARPDTRAGRMPEGFTYDTETQELRFGAGIATSVSQRVVDYTTSGMPVLRKWFAYRKPDPAGKNSGVLSEINSQRWHDEWTDDLQRILIALTWLVALEAPSGELIEQILAGPLVGVAEFA